jgi:hypothetical protein
MSTNEITFDPNYLYINQEKFFPILQEVADSLEFLDLVNGVALRVDCSLDSDFEWSDVFTLAQQAVEAGKWILWELDFHFQDEKVFLQNSAVFYSHGIAIGEFLKTLWTPFKESTIGASLFRGSVDFAKYFVWTEELERHYLEKKEEGLSFQLNERLSDFSKKLFAADIFSDYLHRLSSFFPEELLPFCLLDVSSIKSSAELAFLLSKERFQHILLALKKSKIPLGYLNWEEGQCLGGWIGRGAPYFSSVFEVNIGVCLPLEEMLNEELLQELDFIFEELSNSQVPYRVIPEAYLNEQWDGIDDLIVLRKAISAQGLRKLKGFLAAGGRIVVEGDLLDVNSEISFSDFLK